MIIVATAGHMCNKIMFEWTGSLNFTGRLVSS